MFISVKNFNHHTRFVRFVVFLIPVFLIFLGIRLPDLSQPHKPKPIRRAILEKSPARSLLASVKSVCKVNIDPFFLVHEINVAPSVLEFPLEAKTDYQLAPQLSATPFPPRAPPS